MLIDGVSSMVIFSKIVSLHDPFVMAREIVSTPGFGNITGGGFSVVEEDGAPLPKAHKYVVPATPEVPVLLNKTVSPVQPGAVVLMEAFG